MEWDQGTRIATLRSGADVTRDRATAEAFVAALAAWACRPAHERFGLLVDGSGGGRGDSGWRSVWAAFSREHREMSVAIFDANRLQLAIAQLFRIGVGLHVRAFPAHAAARDWLLRTIVSCP